MQLNCPVLTVLLLGCTMVQAQDSTQQRVLAVQPTPSRVTISLPGNRANPSPKGPFTADWESIKKNYSTPPWFLDGKFGIFIHYGVYTVPAHASEWYPRHMYSNSGVQKWHTEHFGPVDSFGYKDFIPLFTMKKFDAAAWAVLFKKSGAKYIVPTAEHHDGFAMYESKLTHWNAKEMGPRIDFIGELSAAVRKEGLKFGVSNHRMEHWDFMYPQLKQLPTCLTPAMPIFMARPNCLLNVKTRLMVKRSWKTRKKHPSRPPSRKNGWPGARSWWINTNLICFGLITVLTAVPSTR